MYLYDLSFWSVIILTDGKPCGKSMKFRATHLNVKVKGKYRLYKLINYNHSTLCGLFICTLEI